MISLFFDAAGLKTICVKACKASVPRLLLAAALSAGASSVIFAGTARAAGEWTQIVSPTQNGWGCTFDGQCTVGVRSPNPGVGLPGPEDKYLTLLNWSSIPTTADLEFTYLTTDPDSPWHVDLDFNPDDSDGGSLTYMIEATQGQFSFVNFISARDSDTSLEKVYGTGIDSLGNITGIIDTLSLTTNVADQGLAFGTVLYVKDTWQGPGAIDGLSNEFNQAVPGPLPLLGAGAAFGFSRRLRSRIKGSRLA